jgi:hypothetical protein
LFGLAEYFIQELKIETIKYEIKFIKMPKICAAVNIFHAG